MSTFIMIFGIIFVVIIFLAVFTNFGKDHSKRTDEQLLQLYPLHLNNRTAQKSIRPEAYKKALIEFSRLTEELIKRGLRSDTELNDIDLASRFLSEKFRQDDLKDIQSKALVGDPEAQYYIAAAKVATQEHESAFRLLSKAAENGHLDAQYFLAHAYLEKREDMIEAQKWFIICAERGKNNATTVVQTSKKTLPPYIMQEAQSRALKWLQEH